MGDERALLSRRKKAEGKNEAPKPQAEEAGGVITEHCRKKWMY